MQRLIHGPDAASERASAEVLRPVKTGLRGAREFLTGQGSALILASASVAVAAEPAILTGIVPAALAYGAYVLARPVVLPLRLPKSANRRDHNHPAPGSREPQPAAGIIHLGVCKQTSQELWITNLDARQHISVPGVTGAGKTHLLLGLCANALSVGSGFVFVDGKADSELPALIYALARRFGREKDVRVLNFLVQSGDKDSNTFNPLAWAGADAIREMLMSQIEHNPAGGAGGDGNKIFMQRAGQLLGALAPVYVWMRENRGFNIDIDSISYSTELANVIALAFDRRFNVRDRDTGQIRGVDVSAMPPPFLAPLQAYLGDTGGYDANAHRERRVSDKTTEQHSYVKMHFGATFTQLAVSLGHIFRTQNADIDMRDVVLNRRILVVRLPALENSGETTTALGKLTIAAVQNMMAKTLGGKLEGDHAEIIENKPTASPTPFPIIYDELAAYVSVGTAVQLQQGRGLGMSFILGWHDVAGLRNRIGDAAYSLLNNANLQIIMRQNEGGENRRHFENTVGDADVTQTTSFHAAGGGYRQARQADVRRVSRIDWRDLRGQIEGEAIIVHANARIYATTFHAAPDARGAIRLNRPVPLRASGADAKTAAGRIRAIRKAMDGAAAAPEAPPPSNALDAALGAFTDATIQGKARADAADAALAAAGRAPDDPAPATPPPSAGIGAATEFTATLAAVMVAPTAAEAEQATIAAIDKESADMLHMLAAAGRAAGQTPAEASQEAHRALAERDAALDASGLPLPPHMPPEELRALLDGLVRTVRGFGA